MQLGRKFRLNPSPEQAAMLGQWIGCARVIYNRKHDEEQYLEWLRRAAPFSARVFTPDEGESAFVFDQAYSHLKGSKTEEAWLHAAPPQVLRNAMYQRGQAWAGHWREPGVVGRPGRRIKGVNDSILLTKELFTFVPGKTGSIHIAAAKGRVVGDVCFCAHRAYSPPNSATISHDSDGRWWLSFNADDGFDEEGAQVTTLRNVATTCQTPEQLSEVVCGHDVGIVRAITASSGKVVTFDVKKLSKIERWRRRQRSLQRKLARQKRGSGRSRKTKRRISRVHSRIADMRRDHAHQVSRILVDAPGKILAFEALQLRNMVRRPKAVLDIETGQYLPNGAAAKSGLNKSLLNQSLGQIVLFTKYKAARLGKIVVRVPAANSSRECGVCHTVSALNRQTQAQFHCIACGHTANADDNASAIIKHRAVALLLCVLGRSTTQSPEEAANTLGLPKTLLRAACEPGSIPKGSSHLAA